MTWNPIVTAHESDNAGVYEGEVLRALARDIGFDAAFFATLGEPSTTVGLDPATIERALLNPKFQRELSPVKAAALGARGVAIDTTILGERAAHCCGYHRELAAPVKGRHSLIAYLSLRGRALGAMMLGRTGSVFSDDDVERVADVLPAITLGRASFYAPYVSERLPSARTRWFPRERARIGAISIRDRGRQREMLAGDFVWTRADIDEPSRSGWFYVDLFHLAAARARRRTRALFIGCGGGVALRQFAESYPGIALDVVELDPAVLLLARDWYGLGTIPHLTVHEADGFESVTRAPDARWDVVVVDAFDATEVAPRLATRAFFRSVRRILRRGGALAFNAIGPLAPPSPVRTIEQALRAELNDVRLVPVLDHEEPFSPAAIRNVVLLASA